MLTDELMRGTAVRFSIPTNHYMMESSINAIPLHGQEKLAKVQGNLNVIPFTARVR
jgi:hypothetical protein